MLWAFGASVACAHAPEAITSNARAAHGMNRSLMLFPLSRPTATHHKHLDICSYPGIDALVSHATQRSLIVTPCWGHGKRHLRARRAQDSSIAPSERMVTAIARRPCGAGARAPVAVGRGQAGSGVKGAGADRQGAGCGSRGFGKARMIRFALACLYDSLRLNSGINLQPSFHMSGI